MMTQFSLLWPQGTPSATWTITAETIRNLELEAIVAAFSPHSPYRETIAATMYRLCLEPDTIRYRQQVLADLQQQPRLAATLRALLPVLDELTLFSYRKSAEDSALHEVVARAGELELLVRAINQLHQAFTAVSTPLQSSAIQALREHVAFLAADASFQQVVNQLPSLLARLRTSASITIGVNLDHFLHPQEAVLLAVNNFRFSDSTLLDQLLGKGVGQGKGVAPLHRPTLVSKSSGMIMGGLPADGPLRRVDPMLEPLIKDLFEVLEKVTKPIAQELKKYAQLNGRFLINLRPEIIFYVYALDLINQLKMAGMPWCQPEIVAAEARVCEVEDAYNLLLAIQAHLDQDERPLPQRVVANDIVLGEDGRIAILTGPNQGGKTTFMQSLGLIQVLAQLGLPIPGKAGRISPVDAIYTHYPVEERLDLGTGRLGDEAQRIRTIFEQITQHSLVLFNESLASTNMAESFYLARDVIRALRQIGLRAIFTTHLHDLALAVPEINAETPGDSQVISLVASSLTDEPTADQRYSYRVQASPPLGRSYAAHIASRYGISYEQLRLLAEQRKLLPA